jgi:STE24 endopeptidase
VLTLIVVLAFWLVAARLLWATEVPRDLELPRLDPRNFFSEAQLRRAAAHDRFLRVNFLLALLAQVAALWVVARRAPRLDARLPGPPLVRGVALGLLAYLAAWLARLLFGLAGHWWERRYHLATRGYGSWLWHRLPGPATFALLVAAVVAAVLLARVFGSRWWLAAAPLAVGIAAVLVLVQPLFGPKLHPLPPTLSGSVRELTGDVRVGVERASRRTRRVNAEAIGLGSTRRIVFWDTLFDGRFRRDEIRVLAAHEAAHVARRHAWKGLAWFALFALPCAFLVGRAARARGGPSQPVAVPVLLLAVACLQIVALPVAGAITRRYEAEADWAALERTRDPAAAAGLFRRLSVVNVDQPDPPRWAFLVLADHPTLMQRIAMAEAWKRRAG